MFLAPQEGASVEDSFGLAPRGGLVTTGGDGGQSTGGGGCSTGGDGSLGAGLAMLALLIVERRPRRRGARLLQTAAIFAMIGALLGGCSLTDGCLEHEVRQSHRPRQACRSSGVGRRRPLPAPEPADRGAGALPRHRGDLHIHRVPR